MYCELFKLTEPPFRLTPDPQFLFASKQHARAKAYMESTIWLADGFVVITGDIGSGKTTLIESFLTDLPPDIILAHISQTQLTPVEFLQALLVEFGFKPFRKRKVELLSMLKDYMVEQYAAGKKILLIIDEAQNLSRKVLEEVRLLSGLEAQKEKLLRIILAGQPELANKLDSPRLQQLVQRVRLRFHLGALSKRETHEYISHRLKVAGAGDREIFQTTACDVVFRYTGGVPRLVNVLCDTAMLCAFAEERTVVDEALVKAAVEELQWVEFSERLRAQSRHGDHTGRFGNPADRPMGRLEIMFRDQLVGEHRLGFGKTIIGRTPDNDVQIQSRFISRHHAQVVSDETQSILEDLNSTNGVFIRAQRVKHQVLADGDVIQLGEHKLLYRDMRGMAAPRVAVEDDDEDEDDDDDRDDDFEDDEDELDDDDADERDEQQVDERRS
ncbi:MAG TPA: AAA family ATPase [Gammaproteobacteria bacterium]|nr:AAA family ATPase [Gammaproteobacteria bacterium]